jgi:hypothetical protein
MGDKGAQDELMTDLLAILTDDNAAEISRSLSADELNSPFGLAALQRWLKVDASVAADWVAARADATEEQAWAVANRLVEDRQALEIYCDRLPDTPWKQTFLKNAGLELVWKNPVEAICLARRMNPSGEQTNLLRAAAYAWMVSDPNAASGWIMQVPDRLLQEKLVCSGAEAHAATDPLQAAEWLISATPVPSAGSEELMSGTLQTIVGIWVETKPAQVAAVVARFSDGDMRETSVDAVSRRWLQLDPAAATAWIKTLPEGEKILASNHSN